MANAVFWEVMLCSQIQIYGRFVGICSLNLQGVLNWWEGRSDGLIPPSKESYRLSEWGFRIPPHYWRLRRKEAERGRPSDFYGEGMKDYRLKLRGASHLADGGARDYGPVKSNKAEGRFIMRSFVYTKHVRCRREWIWMEPDHWSAMHTGG